MSLIPEKALVISPSLAATIGLEEAVLLHILGEITEHCLTSEKPPEDSWFSATTPQLLHFLPFWNTGDLQRVIFSLRDKGVLQVNSPPIAEYGKLVFSFDSSCQTNRQGIAARATNKSSAALIPSHWQPCSDTLRQLAQYNIPQSFIEQQIPEFTTYWSERSEPQYSWGSKFIKRVLHAWRDQQQQIARQGKETLMHNTWQPSRDALEILTRQSGINPNFCIDAVPEFVLYWQERGEPSSTWNSRFISHVKRQWARYTCAMEHDSEPKPLPSNWQPSESLFEVLTLANIPRPFAEQQIAEFVLYWQESGKVYNSWSTKFLQQVKRQWAQHCNWQQDDEHERQQLTGQAISTRRRSLEEDLTDRSWAQ
ncbi:MAG: hypothetical protein KDI24_06840 [Pseudomonadales bacterium]|nr:hypothetical protein [Pseudomonadales bacterium]